MPNQISIAGRAGSVSGTLGEPGDFQQLGSFQTSDGRQAWIVKAKMVTWTAPFNYKPFTGANVEAGTRAGPSCFMVASFTLQCDFNCVIQAQGGPVAYATPGLGKWARVEFVPGLRGNGVPDILNIGGLARSSGASGPTGAFTLSWNYSPVPTIGGPNEAAAFFDPRGYKATFVTGTTEYPAAVVHPTAANFLGPPPNLGQRNYFVGFEAQIPAGEYLIVFAGGAYSLDQNGFIQPTPQSTFVSSAENTIYRPPFGDNDFTHETLYWSVNGQETSFQSERLPFAAWTQFPPDLPNSAHFTKWSMRYYWKQITHGGGKIMIAATGCVGYDESNPDPKNPTGSNTPKFFLYKLTKIGP